MKILQKRILQSIGGGGVRGKSLIDETAISLVGTELPCICGSVSIPFA